MDNNSIKETTPKKARPRRLNPIIDWFIRLIKGIIIGIGFILPGLSGGVLAVIVGMYDPLIKFLANLKDKFLKNVIFFLPFAIGAAVGIVLFAVVVEKAFGKYAAQFVCLFVGFVAGTFPSLFKTAGKQGQKNKDFLILIFSALGIFTLMLAGEKQLTEINPHILSWLASGFLMGLGLIIPGLSPSNFLIYFGMYDKMATGIKNFNFAVIIPLVIGFILCVILFSKIAAYLFKKYYPGMYHFILGLVIGSSLVIFPTVVFPAFQSDQLATAGLSFTGALLFCLVLFVAGTVASYFFSKLEEKYPREEIF